MQKFFAGDLVQVCEMPTNMSHFDGNCRAIVLGTYRELCSKTNGGNWTRIDEKQYSLYILPNKGDVSWYNEDQLTFIAGDKWSLLHKSDYRRQVYEAKQARDSQGKNDA